MIPTIRAEGANYLRQKALRMGIACNSVFHHIYSTAPKQLGASILSSVGTHIESFLKSDTTYFQLFPSLIKELEK